MAVRSRDAVRALRSAVVQADPACATPEAELFTGPDAFEVEDEAVRRRRERRAKRVCRSCPAVEACLSYALAIRPAEGVWAGRGAAEIRALAIASRTGSVPEVA
ncbi:WhiB family transcriptional regulator [Nonomuraea sp. NPDC050691]|uniref:WhiB family transcriptional regulator n=1 Tax=Nonomuraea sp. NPDC050691 TaxID=3155661 RepID=UPI0033FCD9B2